MTTHYQPFQTTYSDETDFDWDQFDVDWFCDVHSADLARKRLTFLSTPGNIFKLQKHGYGGPALNRMWRAVLRACISYAVPLNARQIHMADSLGVIVP